MIPVAAMLAHTAVAAVAEWRKPHWTAAGATFPGVLLAIRKWEEAAILRTSGDADDGTGGLLCWDCLGDPH